MRIVLDTCVLIAGLRSRLGASFQLLLAIRHGEVTPLLSVPLFLEYEAVLKRPEHLAATGLSAGDIDTVLDVLAARAERRKLYYLWRPVLADPADEMVLELAAQGQAQAIVTHNIRDFAPAAGRFGFEILTPPAVVGALRRNMS